MTFFFGATDSSFCCGSLPLASSAVICALGSTAPDSLADCDVNIFVCNAFPFFSSIYHVCWKRMPINLHRLFGCLKLEPSLFYSRLYLLTKHFALIGVMRRCIVPLAVLDILQLLICRDLVVWLQH